MIHFLRKTVFLGFLGLFAMALIACETTTTTTVSSITSTTTQTTTSTTTTTTTTTQTPKTVPVFLGIELFSSPSLIPVNEVSLPDSISGINPLDPFGDLDEGTIDSVIISDYPLPNQADVHLFANQSEDFFVFISLDNPDQLEIQSFRLNGIDIQRDAFEVESNFEHIVYRMNSGALPGVFDYTITAIEYLDAEVVKEVSITADNVATLAVKSLYPAIVSMTNAVAQATSILFDVDVSLNDVVGDLYFAVLYDGESLVQEQVLSDGQNGIAFDYLEIDTLYQIAVFSITDLLDGSGPSLQILAKEVLRTSPIFVVTNLVPTVDAVTFELVIQDADAVGFVFDISVRKDGDVVATLPNLDVLGFSALLSNNTYTLVVNYAYDLLDGQGVRLWSQTYEFTTLAKTMPLVELVTIPGTFGFDTLWTDLDSISHFVKAELFLGDVFVMTLDETLATSGLLSNTEYTLKLTYGYDLNDGLGLQEVTILAFSKTEAKALPIVQFRTLLKETQKIGIQFIITDDDSVITETPRYSVYRGTTLVKIGFAQSSVLIDNLLASTWHEIVVTVNYDLNDGLGVQTFDTSFNERTNTVTAPEANVQITTITSTYVDFSISITDLDLSLVSTTIELKIGETVVQTFVGGLSGTFSGLLSNTEYEIRVTVYYDPQDGTANLTKEFFRLFLTQS